MNDRGAPQKMLVLGSLYFSQGLPFGFFVQALPVLLRKQGFSLGQIGLSSLLAMPWALKFLWSPAVDRWSWGAIGHRKSWIIPSQLLSTTALVGLALLTWRTQLRWVLVGVLFSNLLTATQDIATDGLSVDLMEPKERGMANGLKVAGYRAGMIVGGGALLGAYDRLGWRWTFLLMAALIMLASLPVVLLHEEPRSRHSVVPENRPSHFLRRPGAKRILLLLVTYKLGDAFATGMLRPFFSDLGLGLADIGWLLGTIGFVAGLLGALCGGLLVNRLGRRRALVGFAFLQAATVAGYTLIAVLHPGRGWLGLLCGAEHFAAGMATAALFTCMMDWCGREASATDYSVQASAVVLATGLASALSGYSAEALGYVGHFSLATLLAGGSVLVVLRLFPMMQTTASISAPPEGAPSCA